MSTTTAPASRSTSGLAVTALVLSLVWGFGFLSIAGLICAMVAYADTRSGARGGHAATILALIFGGLGTAGFILFWAAMILGSLV